MQGTPGELTSSLASGEGRLPHIHLHLSCSEDVDIDSQARKKVGDSLSQTFDSTWGKTYLIFAR